MKNNIENSMFRGWPTIWAPPRERPRKPRARKARTAKRRPAAGGRTT